MKFDKWFYSQSKLIQILLLLIPVVGWIVEILVRLSCLSRKANLVNIIVFLLYIFAGWAYVLEIIDIVLILLGGKLFLAE